MDRSLAFVYKRFEVWWSPTQTYDVSDGEGLNRLLYVDGPAGPLRPWCAPSVEQVLARAMSLLEQQIMRARDRRRSPFIRVLDYGTGTGMAATKLLEALETSGLSRTMNDAGIQFELVLADIPFAWFATAWAQLGRHPQVRFVSLIDEDSRSFLPLASVLGVDQFALVLCTMVFHLIPPRSFPLVAEGIAAALERGGCLLWNTPDLGPRRDDALLAHDANRRLRARLLEVLENPTLLESIVDRVPAPDRATYVHLPARVAALCDQMTPEARAQAAERAIRQIRIEPTDVAFIASELRRHLSGKISLRTCPITQDELVTGILVPANQRLLSEIEDPELRRQLTVLLMRHDVVPSLSEGPYGHGDGVSLLWTFGEFHRMP